ncbi:unnamed protein product, partial [Prunus brigantina]
DKELYGVDAGTHRAHLPNKSTTRTSRAPHRKKLANRPRPRTSNCLRKFKRMQISYVDDKTPSD